MIVVGVMAVIALGLLEPANIAVLIELKKTRPNPEVIEKLMKRFVYCCRRPRRDAGRDVRDHDQAGERMTERKLPPVTQVGDGLAGADRRRRDLSLGAPAPARAARTGGDPARPSACSWSATCSRSRVSPTSRWSRFFDVAKWSLLAYAAIAGLIVYAFLQDHVSGGAARRPDALAGDLRGPRSDADRVHGRAVLRRRRPATP